MPRSAIAAFISIAFAASAGAQTSTVPDGVWRGSLGAGLSATRGNTDSATYTINGDIVKQGPYDKISGYVQGVYGSRALADRTERTSDQQRAGGLYNRDINDRQFAFGSLDFERNKLINLSLRSVVAGGLGYHVIRREGLTFDVSTGPAYNHEHYTTETREAAEWLFAEESTHALTPTVSFRQRLAYYPSLKDTGEFRAVFDAGVVFKVTRQWSATVTLNDRYQTNPLNGVEKNDLLFVTGLQYVFNPLPEKKAASSHP